MRSPLSTRARRLLAPLLLALAVALPACGDDDTGGGGPDPADIPSQAVAVVDGDSLSKLDLDRKVAMVRRSSSGSSKLSAAQLEQQAMTALLQEAWLTREAERRGVRVTGAEVRRRLATARRQFAGQRAFQRFLGRQTVGDLLSQLRMQLLGAGLDEAARKDGEDPAEFRKDYQEDWRDRTTCRRGYIVPSCRNA